MLMSAGVLAMAAGIVKTILYGEFNYDIDIFYTMTILSIWM
jgi:hypothetical protein